MRRNKATENEPGEIQKSAPGAQEEAQLLPSKWGAKLHNGQGPISTANTIGRQVYEQRVLIKGAGSGLGG